jgi:ABC-type sulfate transport system permease component
MSPVRRLSPFWIVLGVIAAGYLGFWFAMLAATATYTSPREVIEVLLSREIRYATLLSLVTCTASALLSAAIAVSQRHDFDS